MRSPRILVVTRHFPPFSFVAGNRLKNIAKYLGQLGWDVTVITPNPNLSRYDLGNFREIRDFNLIYTDHFLKFLTPSLRSSIENTTIKRLISGMYRRFIYNDIYIGWYLNLSYTLHKEIKKKKYNVILVSGPPFLSFLVVYFFARRENIPYVVDYRDLWVFNPHRISSKYLKFDRAVEKLVIKNASLVLTVSESCKNLMMQEYPFISEKLKVLFNGFDPDDFDNLPNSRSSRDRHIIYAGSFHLPKRSITPIIRALNILKGRSSCNNIKFYYFGNNASHVLNEADREGVRNLVEVKGVVNKKELYNALLNSCLGVVITSVYPTASLADRGIVTGKIFELLGLKVPILLIAPPGSDARKVLEVSNAGTAFTGEEIKKIANFIEDVCCNSGINFTFEGRNEYSWPKLIKSLDGHLKNILKQR